MNDTMTTSAIRDIKADAARVIDTVAAGGVAVFPVSCWAYEPFRALANPLVLVPESEGMTKVGARTVKFNVFHRPERTEVTFEGRRRFVLRRVSAGMAQNAALALALASELGVKDAALQARLHWSAETDAQVEQVSANTAAAWVKCCRSATSTKIRNCSSVI